jgi:2'-5' RNA ligase
VRLFLAIEPDFPARKRLADLSRDVQSRLGVDVSAQLRWSRAEGIHVTLHFLGEVGADRLRNLQQSLGPVLNIPPFPIATGRLGTFPPSGPARVIWIAVEDGAHQASSVHAELGRRLTAAGLAIDPRPLSPHLTLARVRDPRHRAVRGLRAALHAIDVEAIRWMAERVTLFRSHMSSSGPPAYESLHYVRMAAGG